MHLLPMRVQGHCLYAQFYHLCSCTWWYGDSERQTPPELPLLHVPLPWCNMFSSGTQLPALPPSSLLGQLCVHQHCSHSSGCYFGKEQRGYISPCAECLLEVRGWVTAITRVSEVKGVMSNWGLTLLRMPDSGSLCTLWREVVCASLKKFTILSKISFYFNIWIRLYSTRAVKPGRIRFLLLILQACRVLILINWCTTSSADKRLMPDSRRSWEYKSPRCHVMHS